MAELREGKGEENFIQFKTKKPEKKKAKKYEPLRPSHYKGPSPFNEPLHTQKNLFFVCLPQRLTWKYWTAGFCGFFRNVYAYSSLSIRIHCLAVSYVGFLCLHHGLLQWISVFSTKIIGRVNFSWYTAASKVRVVKQNIYIVSFNISLFATEIDRTGGGGGLEVDGWAQKTDRHTDRFHCR